MLMAAGIEVPDKVTIHGYLTLGEHKMSKSLGNVIEPFHVADVYGPDALRFYVLREVSFGADGEVSPEGFDTRYTTELANEYGNLASRTLAMIERYRDGVVPSATPPGEIAAEFDGLVDAVKARIDEVELTAALDEIWRRIKRLNRYVQDEAPWQLAKDDAESDHLDQVLYTLAEGLRVVSVLLHPFMPGSAERLWRRWAARTCRSTAPRWARSRAARRSPSSGSSSRASRPRRRPPEAEPVIDSHCHLDYCEPPVAELVGRARAAGVDADGHRGHERRGDPARDRGRRGPRRGGGDRRPPSPRDGRLRRRSPSRRSSARRRTRASAPSGRPGSTTTATTHRATTSAAPSRRSSSWPRAAALPVVIHTRAAEDDTFAVLREHAGSVPVVVMHCFSAPDRLEECVERGYMCSFAGNVTYPKATDLQEAARQVPDELLLVETDSPYLAPQPVRGKPNEPANVAHTARFVADLRGVSYEELERTVAANFERVFGP